MWLMALSPRKGIDPWAMRPRPNKLTAFHDALMLALKADARRPKHERRTAKALYAEIRRDVFQHPTFDNGGHPGTYGLCNASNKINYILLSPKLYQRVQTGGVMRQGMWPGVRPEALGDLRGPGPPEERRLRPRRALGRPRSLNPANQPFREKNAVELAALAARAARTDRSIETGGSSPRCRRRLPPHRRQPACQPSLR